LAIVDGLSLDGYRYLHATRAEPLRRLGGRDEEQDAYRRALELVDDDTERRHLERRLQMLVSDGCPPHRSGGDNAGGVHDGCPSLGASRRRRPRGSVAFHYGALGLAVRPGVFRSGDRMVTLVTPGQPSTSRSRRDVRAAMSAPCMCVPRCRTTSVVRLISPGTTSTPFDNVVTTPGVEVWQEPITQSSGVRDIVVLDPAGNVVRITQE
jgi:hypothetical protein